MIGISACLAGKCCRYDGKHKKIDKIAALTTVENAVLICPEVTGGLSVPRKPAEIVGGDGNDVWAGTAKVIDSSGKDVTEAFKQGAILSFEKLKKQNIDTVILKDASPSCGNCQIYNGQFSGTKISGLGVTAAYFKKHGLHVFSEQDWLEHQKKE